jgi:hypothetical protein
MEIPLFKKFYRTLVNSILLNKDVKEIGIHITRGERGPLYCFIILIE